MGDILVKAFGFVFIIIVAYLFKRLGIFKLQDKDFLGNILLSVCLPCVIISGFKTFEYDSSLIFAIFLGLIANFLGLFVGWITTLGKERNAKTLQMMATAGYNIGIFTVPFISSFLSSTALVGALMFDIGNAIMVFGTSAAVTAAVVHKKRENPLPELFTKLRKSVPFNTYIIMLILLGLGINLPDQVYIVTDIGASATAFLAMVMIGIMIEFKIEKSEIKEVLSAVASRYVYTAIIAFLIYLLPFSIEVRKALMIAVSSPLSTASVVFTEKLGCKPSITGVVSSLCIVISMIAIVGIIIFV